MSFCVLTIISFISPAQASTFGQAPTVSYAVDLNDPQEQEHVNPYGLFPQPFRFKSRFSTSRIFLHLKDLGRPVSTDGGIRFLARKNCYSTY